MASPRFSKICTQRFVAPSSAVWSAQRSMTSRTSPSGMCVSVRSWRGREADDATGARCRACHEEAVVDRLVGDVRLQGREVVGEDEGRGVLGVALAVGADVAGAEVAVRVVPGRSSRRCRSLCPSHGRRVRPAETSTHWSLNGS